MLSCSKLTWPSAHAKRSPAAHFLSRRRSIRTLQRFNPGHIGAELALLTTKSQRHKEMFAPVFLPNPDA